MSGSSKRLWSPNSTLDEAQTIMNGFLTRCQDKRILNNSDIKLYQAYRFEQTWPTENLIEISKYLRFSKNDNPETDIIRESILKLLSSAMKAHIYFDENAIIRHEPYMFMIPDIFKQGQFRYGIYYPIESNKKNMSIIVSEWDISFSSSSLPKINPWDKFASVITPDTKKWFDIKQYKDFKDMDKTGYFKINDWSARKKYQSLISSKDNNNFDLGKIINSKAELKDYYSILGLEWSPILKKWFIPKGLDFKAIMEYLAFINNQTQEQRYNDCWWTKSKKPQ